MDDGGGLGGGGNLNPFESVHASESPKGLHNTAAHYDFDFLMDGSSETPANSRQKEPAHSSQPSSNHRDATPKPPTQPPPSDRFSRNHVRTPSANLRLHYIASLSHMNGSKYRYGRKSSRLRRRPSLTSTASTLDDFLTPANSTPKPVRQMAQQPPTIKPAPTPIPAPAPRPKPVVTQRAAPADADDPPKWACQKCTFHNLIGIDICEMCGKSSPMRLANLEKRRSSPALPPPLTTPSQYTQNYPGVQAASVRRSIGTVRSVDNIGMSAGSGVPIAVIEAEPVDWRISNGGDRIGRPQSAQYSRPPMAKLAPMPSAGGELLRVPIVIQVRTKQIFKKWKPAVLVLTDTHMSVYNVRNGETTRRASVEPFSPSRFPARGEASSPFADSPPGRAPANDNVGDDGDVGTAIRYVRYFSWHLLQ